MRRGIAGETGLSCRLEKGDVNSISGGPADSRGFRVMESFWDVGTMCLEAQKTR